MNLHNLVPYAKVFKTLLNQTMDCLIAVADLKSYIFVENSHNFSLGVSQGDIVKQNTVIATAMKSGKPCNKMMDRTLFGIPYIATAIPIWNEQEEVCGGLVLCISTDRQEKLATSATDLSAMTEELSATAQTMSLNAEELANANTEVENMAIKLNGYMEDISTVNDVISEISQQTNLLGLNAAIEAAHAADRGRGFAVVAKEVRRLSSQSRDSAESVITTVEVVHESVQRLAKQAKTIATLSREQAAGSQELSSIIEEINRMAILLSEMSEDVSTM